MTDAVERALDSAYAFIAQFRADELSEGRFQQWEAAKKAIKDAHVALASPAAESAAVPDGWQLVPKEPTDEMLEASFGQAGESNEMRKRHCVRMRRHYIAMLAAALTPPVQPVSDEPLTMSMFGSRADLEAANAKQSDEPVAWQRRYRTIGKSIGEWTEWSDGRAPKTIGSSYEVEERPLYTRPQPVKEAVEAARENIEKALRGLSIPEHKRDDAEFLRVACMVGKSFAEAALASLSQEQG